MNYVKSFLLSLGLILSLTCNGQENILVSRREIEACLEWLQKYKLSEVMNLRKDSTITDLRTQLKNDSAAFATYKSDSIAFETRINNLEKVSDNKGVEIKTLTDRIRQINRSRWGERIGLILIIILEAGIILL